MNSAIRATGTRRNHAALLFILACVWIAAAVTAGRLASTVAPAAWRDVARQCATAALLAAGLYTISRSYIDDLRPLSSIGFVRRPSAGREFALGLALGWSIALALILPAVFTGNFSLNVFFDAPHLFSFFLAVLTLIAFACCVQLIMAGLPAQLLLRTIGPTWTVVAVLLLAFCLILSGRVGNDGGIVFGLLSAALFSFAYLRTRAIWLPLGLQLGWMLILQLLFGVSMSYTPAGQGLLGAYVGGAKWLTGGFDGPEASVFAPLVVVAALLILFRITHDYAWHYTYQPFEGAGRPVEVQPPAAHVREEARAAEPLVQIGGIAPVPSGSKTEPFQ